MSEKQTETVSEICQIRIMFPVKSDEQAIEYKKKIVALMAEISDANIQFNLTTMPQRKNGN